MSLHLFSNSSIIGRTILARTNSSEGKPDPVEYQDQQYKITLKIEGKADWTANGPFIIYRRRGGERI